MTDGLRDRYASLAAGSSSPDDVWLNWIVRRRADSRSIGTMQAAVTSQVVRSTAHMAIHLIIVPPPRRQAAPGCNRPSTRATANRSGEHQPPGTAVTERWRSQ